MYQTKKLKSLEKKKEQIELEILVLTEFGNNCSKQIKEESNAYKRQQLRAEKQNYDTDINDLYDELDKIEEQIDKLESNDKNLSLNNLSDNFIDPKQLKIDKSLCYLDFKKALETFEKIQSQFDQDRDFALFLIEESLIKRGDLFLQRLRNYLTSKTYHYHFRHCTVTYSSGNLESVVQGIANYFGVSQVEATIESVIQKIVNSLQNNSVVFIEINCDINNQSEIEPLIIHFINNFWQPLMAKINKIIKNYTGIKVITVIISNIKLNQIFLTEKLSSYLNNDCNYFARDKLVKIPLENWTENDIKEWLIEYSHPSLTIENIEIKACRVFQESLYGIPSLVCDALQQQWQTSTHPNSSY